MYIYQIVRVEKSKENIGFDDRTVLSSTTSQVEADKRVKNLNDIGFQNTKYCVEEIYEKPNYWNYDGI